MATIEGTLGSLEPVPNHLVTTCAAPSRASRSKSSILEQRDNGRTPTEIANEVCVSRGSGRVLADSHGGRKRSDLAIYSQGHDRQNPRAREGAHTGG